MGDGIVIVGAGFAGFWAVVAARRVAGPFVAITMVAPAPSLVIRPRLYEANPATLAVDIAPHLDALGVTFVPGEAVGLEPSTRALLLADGLSIGYERLVVATGSSMHRPTVAGVDSAHSVDSLAEAVAFDRRLSELVALPGPVTVAVVGAGFTGIELSLELRDRLAEHGGLTFGEDARIVLIDRAAEVGAELGEGPREAIMQALDEARVERLLGVTIDTIAPSRIALSGRAPLDVDVVVLATGMIAAGFTASVPGERDATGRVVVDQHLRAPSAPDVFVTGDSAHADTGDGHIALQSCQHALQFGRFAGENAARNLLGQPLVDYRHPGYVTCLDLGRSGAVFTQGWDRQVRMTGVDAKALKININERLIYPPSPDDLEALLAASNLPNQVAP